MFVKVSSQSMLIKEDSQDDDTKMKYYYNSREDGGIRSLFCQIIKRFETLLTSFLGPHGHMFVIFFTHQRSLLLVPNLVTYARKACKSSFL